MEIITQRLNLREITLSDLNAIHELLSLPETDFYNALGLPESIQVTKGHVDKWIEHQHVVPRTLFTFAIKEQVSGRFTGLISITLGKPKYRNAEVWFKIHKKQWGKGYATEAFTRLIQFGFKDLGLHRIEAGCAIENIASRKVIEKCGLTLEGTIRKLLPHQGGWLDCYSYAILDED